MKSIVKPTLIYVGDPMCSWCYGLAPHLDKVLEEYTNRIDFHIIMGGLRPYNKQVIADMKSFLESHWRKVEAASGQSFNTDILSDTTITYDTEPPCRAVVIVRNMDAKQAYLFYKKVQRAFYFENKNLHIGESYHSILEDLALDIEEFSRHFQSDHYKSLVREDFVAAAEMGIRGYPTLILQKADRLHMICNGYNSSEHIIQKISLHLDS